MIAILYAFGMLVAGVFKSRFRLLHHYVRV